MNNLGIYTILILVVIGVMTGAFSGFLGIGGGLILIPALVYFMGFGQHEAIGTSLDIPASTLKKIFSVFLILIAIKMFFSK